MTPRDVTTLAHAPPLADPVAMVDFSDYEQARRWFAAQPREVAVVMAARAALRVLPLLEPEHRRPARGYRSTVILPGFRAAVAAWAVARFPNRGLVALGAASGYAGGAPFGETAGRAALAALDAAAFAARTADAPPDGYHAATAAFAVAHAASSAVDAADARPADSAAARAAYDAATSADATFIEGVSRPVGRRRRAVALAGRALWPDSIPGWVPHAWSKMNSSLLRAGEDWEVWTLLYNDLLGGLATNDPNVAFAYVAPPNALWRDGPKAINAEIKRRLAELQQISEPPDEAGLPQQSPRAAIFTIAEGGVIGLAPPTLRDRLADLPEVREFYDEVREKAEYLAGLSVNMLGTRLHRAIGRCLENLPEPIEDAIERRVWSTCNALRVILAEYVAAAGDPSHPHALEPSVAQTLRGFVEEFNQLAFADPSLRQRDMRRPGPQEVDRVTAALKIAIEIIPPAAGNRAITNTEAGNELDPQIEIARDRIEAGAGGDLPGKLGADHAAETTGNFVSHAVLQVARAARDHLAGAAKDATSGFYRMAGATIFASAWAQTQQISPALIHWVIASADQLAALGLTFYEHVPAFRQTVEWLRACVRDDEQSE